MTGAVGVGVTLPSFVDDAEVPIAVARAAEAAGLDGVFAYDHLFREARSGRRPAQECFALLGAVAAETARVALGTFVARATLRPPATLRLHLDTLQRVSGGRVIAGLGSGDHDSAAENEEFGLRFGTMASRVESLHDAVVAIRGRGYPVWVGGTAAPVRELAVLADGWNCWGVSVPRFGELAAQALALAPQAVLSWGGLVVVGATDAEARAKAERLGASASAIVGGPQRVADSLGGYVAAGARWLVIGPVDSGDPGNAPLLAEVRGHVNAAAASPHA